MRLINAQNMEHITEFFTLFVSVHNPSRSFAGTRDEFKCRQKMRVFPEPEWTVSFAYNGKWACKYLGTLNF